MRSEAQPQGQATEWLGALLGAELPPEGGAVTLAGQRYVMRDGILRSEALSSEAQQQTEQTFAFKWHKRDTFESPASLRRMRDWLRERYGAVEDTQWFQASQTPPVLLDAGCGGGMSALELFDAVLPRVRYLGVDISDAVTVARARFQERGLPGVFLQADLTRLPLPHRSVDLIFSEGVLHHTDSTETALHALAPLLRPDGRFLFYVYRRKGPIREFTDDYIRERLQSMTAPEAWDALMPLTQLGKALGELDVEVDVPEAVPLLEIPAGRINLQRLFYWHICKAFYHEELNLEEMNHINFDWFTPRNAHRQSPEEVQAWCRAAGLEIEREVVEPAGITIVARKV